MPLYGITGATGRLGGTVAHLLAGAGVQQRLIVRDPARAPDLPGADVRAGSFDDPAALAHALDGVDVLLFVSAGESAERKTLHHNVVEAAAGAEVQRVVYTSFLGAAPDCTFTFGRDHAATEDMLTSARLPSTFLRNSFYLDVLPDFITDGAIRGPAGRGRVGAVAIADAAAVAAAALLEDDHVGRTYDVTGPQALTLAEVAASITAAGGSEVTYVGETLDEAYESRSGYGAPRWMVDGWVSTYTAIAAGDLDVVTTTVADLAGRAPTSLAELLRPRT